MASRIKGITIEIGGDATGLDKALAGVDSKLSSTQKQLNDVNRLLKLDPTNTTLLEQKQKLLGNAVAQTRERLDQLTEAQKQMDAEVAAGGQKNVEQYEALQREIVATQQKLEGFTAQQTGMQNTAEGANKLETGLKNASAAATVMKGAVVGAAIAGAKALGNAALEVIRYSDDLNTLSKQSGFTTKDLQKMSYAADLVDVSQEAIIASGKKLRQAMKSNSEEVAAAFNRIGVSTRDAEGNFRDSTDVYYEVLRALSEVGNETERDALAMTILGRNADELAGIIDDGGEALKRFGDEAEKSGLILTQEELDRLNEANDILDTIKAKVTSGFRVSLADTVLDFYNMFSSPREYFADLGDKFSAVFNNPVSGEYGSSALHSNAARVGHATQGGLPSSGAVNVNINFEGDLAQLGAVLEPSITAETKRKGVNFAE